MALTYTYIGAITAVGAPIDWEAFAEIETNFKELDTRVGLAPADSTFNGIAGRSVTIASQGGTAYTVIITPTANTGGNLGEVWVTIDSATQFTVYNTGTFTGAFRYKVMQ